MFQAFTNQVWSVSDGAKVSQAATTDTGFRDARKIIFTDGLNESATLSFDSILLSGFEEVTMYVNIGRQLTSLDNVLKITVAGQDYDVPKPTRDGWVHILIDCQALGAADSIVFESLLANQTFFVDLIGARKFDAASIDTDVVDAIIDAVSLDYGVETTLAAAAVAADRAISLASPVYVFNTSRLRISSTVDDVTTSEEVDLVAKSGKLKGALVNSYPEGAIVTVLCPVVGEDADGIEPDPVCGVNISDIQTNVGLNTPIDMLGGGGKIKYFLGEVLIQVYIDCSSKAKVLELSRKYQREYGAEFQIILDGEPFDIYLDNSQFLDQTEAGNNARMSFFYKVQPSPATVETLVRVTDLTITISPEGA